MSEWREASKAEPCDICGKPNWCSITGPESAHEAVVCMRIESGNPRPNGGWHHRLRDSARMDCPAPRKSTSSSALVHARDAVAALEKQLGPRSKTWTYTDAKGDPVGLVLRWDREGDKTIRPVARVANGWVIAAMPALRPLYGLPEVLKAQAVFVVEGEKAADALRSLGLCATTSSGGSAAAAKTDWPPLAGKTLVLWPDNDQPGEKYISDVIAQLAKLTPRPTASIIRPAGLPPKGDAADWVAAGGTNNELEKLIQGAAPVQWPAKSKNQFTDLTAAAAEYLDKIASGETGLISLGVAELDYAIGGGVAMAEMIIAAARPGHGKSAFALQAVHEFTRDGLATLVISEEMSELALGKRTLQWASSIPLDRWERSIDELRSDLEEYKAERAKCIISKPCGTIEAVVEAIELAVAEHGVQVVVVDYAQLLRGRGNSRYEQVTHVSNTLRETTTRLNVLMLVLVQLNREVEKRARFIPTNADIRDSGSLEQDADVVLLLAWPHRVNSDLPANQFQIFVTKNRSRAINQSLVVCRFDPSRQMITETSARDMSNYHPEFDDETAFDPFP